MCFSVRKETGSKMSKPCLQMSVSRVYCFGDKLSVYFLQFMDGCGSLNPVWRGPAS